MTIDLDAIRARYKAATEGPWTWDRAASNSTFRAHADQDIPDLLAEIERLQKAVADEIEESNDVVDGYRKHAHAMVERAKRAEAEVKRLQEENDALNAEVGVSHSEGDQ